MKQRLCTCSHPWPAWSSKQQSRAKICLLLLACCMLAAVDVPEVHMHTTGGKIMSLRRTNMNIHNILQHEFKHACIPVGLVAYRSGGEIQQHGGQAEEPLRCLRAISKQWYTIYRDIDTPRGHVSKVNAKRYAHTRVRTAYAHLHTVPCAINTHAQGVVCSIDACTCTLILYPEPVFHCIWEVQ